MLVEQSCETQIRGGNSLVSHRFVAGRVFCVTDSWRDANGGSLSHDPTFTCIVPGALSEVVVSCVAGRLLVSFYLWVSQTAVTMKGAGYHAGYQHLPY